MHQKAGKNGPSFKEDATMRFDDIIIGGGLSGLLCGISLAESGRKCLIVSQGQSTLNFSSGALDFLKTEEGESFEEALERLPQEHPYKKIAPEKCFLLRAEVAGLLDRAGIGTFSDIRRNHWRITPLGVLSQTWLSLEEMAHFDKEALPEKVLIVNIAGFLDFSPSLLASGLAEQGVRSEICEVSVRETDTARANSSEFRSVNLARVLDGYAASRLAEAVNGKIGDCDFILLPAVFGLESDTAAVRFLQMLDKPAALVPTMNPSVPGIRLQYLLKKRFKELGGTFLAGDTACDGIVEEGKMTALRTRAQGNSLFEAENFVFAGGSFFSEGLIAGKDEIYEGVLGLDVDYSGSHGDWFNPDVFGEQPYMSFGLRTDENFRVSLKGRTLENAYAAGQILSGAAPFKNGCLGGLSAITALQVASMIKND